MEEHYKIPSRYDDEDIIAEATWSSIALALALILSFVTGITIGMITVVGWSRKK